MIVTVSGHVRPGSVILCSNARTRDPAGLRIRHLRREGQRRWRRLRHFTHLLRPPFTAFMPRAGGAPTSRAAPSPRATTPTDRRSRKAACWTEAQFPDAPSQLTGSGKTAEPVTRPSGIAASESAWPSGGASRRERPRHVDPPKMPPAELRELPSDVSRAMDRERVGMSRNASRTNLHRRQNLPPDPEVIASEDQPDVIVAEAALGEHLDEAV